MPEAKGAIRQPIGQQKKNQMKERRSKREPKKEGGRKVAIAEEKRQKANDRREIVRAD